MTLADSARARRRRWTAGIAGAALVSAFLSLAGPVAQASGFAPLCSDPSATGVVCLVSATRDGVDASSRVYVSTDTSSGWWLGMYYVGNISGGEDLGASELGHTWTITINTRANVPRVSSVYGTPGTVQRTVSGADHVIAITSTPVKFADNSFCNSITAVCPVQSLQDWTLLQGEVDDPRWVPYSTVSPSAWDGANTWTNIEETFFPPILGAGGALSVQVSNSHLWHDGTLVHGFLVQELPYALLKAVMGVDDPASLSGSGVVTTISAGGSGTFAVTLNDAVGILTVAASDITFSKRVVTIKHGVIVPRAGVVSRAYRTAAHTTVDARVLHGVSRGSRVLGYQVRCLRYVGTHLTTVRYGTSTSPAKLLIAVGRVPTGGRVVCEVRVRSKAGYGPWSKPVSVRAHA
jgi:hypothetical protein